MGILLLLGKQRGNLIAVYLYFCVIGGSVAAALYFAFLTVTKLLALRLLRVILQVSPLETAPGETVHVQVSFTAGASYTVKEIHATLLGYEHVVIGTSPTTLTREETFFTTSKSLSNGPAPVRVGQGYTFEGKLQIPDDAPPSFHGQQNLLCWAIDLTIDIPLGTRWTDRVLLSVSPGSPNS
jgi:hypothetical protein